MTKPVKRMPKTCVSCAGIFAASKKSVTCGNPQCRRAYRLDYMRTKEQAKRDSRPIQTHLCAICHSTFGSRRRHRMTCSQQCGRLLKKLRKVERQSERLSRIQNSNDRKPVKQPVKRRRYQRKGIHRTRFCQFCDRPFASYLGRAIFCSRLCCKRASAARDNAARRERRKDPAIASKLRQLNAASLKRRCADPDYRNRYLEKMRTAQAKRLSDPRYKSRTNVKKRHAYLRKSHIAIFHQSQKLREIIDGEQARPASTARDRASK